MSTETEIAWLTFEVVLEIICCDYFTCKHQSLETPSACHTL